MRSSNERTGGISAEQVQSENVFEEVANARSFYRFGCSLN